MTRAEKLKRAARRASYQRNRERERFSQAANRAGVPAGYERERLWSVFELHGRACALTGRALRWGDNASIDHIVPRARGGSNRVENLCVVHKDANTAKMALTNVEFVQLCVDVVRTCAPHLLRKPKKEKPPCEIPDQVHNSVQAKQKEPTT